MSEEEKLCKNCGRLIASDNYLTHSLHCVRHLVVCPKCNERVADLHEHNKEQHGIFKCDQCGTKYEQGSVHDCPKRLVPCQHCELEVALCDLASHTAYCGSRTSPCERCQQFVMHRDMARHHCSRPVPALVTQDLAIPDRFAEQAMATGGMSDFQLSELTRMLQGTRINQAAPAPGSHTCELCGLIVTSLNTHYESECPAIHDGMNRLPADQARAEVLNPDDLGAAAAAAPVGADHGADFAMLPCEFCEDIYPLDQLLTHQVNCRRNPGLTPRTQTPAAGNRPIQRFVSPAIRSQSSEQNVSGGAAKQNHRFTTTVQRPQAAPGVSSIPQSRSINPSGARMPSAGPPRASSQSETRLETRGQPRRSQGQPKTGAGSDRGKRGPRPT